MTTEGVILNMKTATVTWSTYNNFGTVLQAFALQKTIEGLGAENIIISDERIIQDNLQVLKENKFIVESYEKSLRDNKAENGNTRNTNRIRKLIQLFSHPIYFSKRVPYYVADKFFPSLRRKIYKEIENTLLLNQEKCEDFKKLNMKILYGKSRQDMNELNCQYDLFICGSDQIWNPSPRCYFDSFFYLDFVNKRKVSYAPSVGLRKIPKQYTERIKEYLADFNSVSVRESETAKQLSELLGKDVKWVLDPTLLQTKRFWNEVALDSTIPKIRSKYLLCYFLENEKWYFEYVTKLARRLKLKVVLIPNKKEFCVANHLRKNGVGPMDFLYLVSNASFVVTDSYHGLLFSILFEKQFVPLRRFDLSDEMNENIRIDSILELFSLEDLLVTEENSNTINPINISYSETSMILNKKREESLSYLRKAIYDKS